MGSEASYVPEREFRRLLSEIKTSVFSKLSAIFEAGRVLYLKVHAIIDHAQLSAGEGARAPFVISRERSAFA
jgi:hypothetical protein